MSTAENHEADQLPAQGQFHVVLKGEAAVFLNGKKLQYDEQSRPDSCARTRQVTLREGDVVVLQVASSYVHRCVRMGFVSNDARLVLPVRLEYLRRVDQLPLQDINAAAIRASHTGATEARPDKTREGIWADLRLPLDDSDWFWGPDKGKNHQLGFIVDSSKLSMARPQKRFRVALSFAGENRAFVEQVADHLAARVGRKRVLYDNYYEADFARPELDTYLQDLYHKESELIAVFLCADYERKEWCGLEWRAIRDLIKRRHASIVMPLRFDNTEIPGLFSTDGYVPIEDRPADEVAKLILKRLQSNAESDNATGVSAAISQAGIPPEAVARGNPAEETAKVTSTPPTSDECEDGTNVPRGTPFFVQAYVTQDWYRPNESESAAGWRERWARLRARFEKIIDNCRPAECLLTEKRVPAYPSIAPTRQNMLAGHELLQGGCGLGCEPSFLFGQDSSPLFGIFPFRDVKGRPMSNSAGEAFGFHLGLFRQFLVYAERNGLRDDRALPGPRLGELARDGTALL